jgi:CrcB protein
MASKIIWIAIAGACGTLARYSLVGIVHRWFGTSFPWGTAAVNILGCLLFGLVWAAAGERSILSPELRTYILVGFMGAFTTFSTFISETSQLLSDQELLLGFANVSFQVIVGIGAFYLGLFIVRAI